MSVTRIDNDVDNLTTTVVADFEAPIEKVWQLWADPRKLERWWGPPGYPAKFESHELSPGGEMAYYMTSPEGEELRGWWRVNAVNPPESLDVIDGFADERGDPVADMPIMTLHTELTENNGGTRVEMVSGYQSREQMEQIMDMGGPEGIRESMGQMDSLLQEQ